MLLTEKMVKVLQGRRLIYLLNDSFPKDAAAPLVASIASLPGPGLMKKAADTGNNASISGSEMVQVGVGVADPQYYWTTGAGASFGRITGRAIIAKIRADGAGGGCYLGWSQSPTIHQPDNFIYFPGDGAINYREFISGVSNTTVVLIQAADYTGPFNGLIALVQRSNSAAMFIKGAGESNWRYLYHGLANDTQPLYPVFNSRVAGKTFYLDWIHVRDLGGVFSTDGGIMTLNVASPTTATNYAGDPDAQIDLTVTSPGVLTGPMELNYRYVDDNNRWVAYFDSTGAFKADSIVGGVRTNRVSVAAQATASTTYLIQVICDGPRHLFIAGLPSGPGQQGTVINVATPMDTIGTVRPVLAANWSMANLVDFPCRSSFYSLLDAV